jgi:PAS domain S-box-containing protein
MDKPLEQGQLGDFEHMRERLQVLRHSVDEMDQLLDRYIASEHALRESEERFRLLVTGAQDYAIFMLDVTGRIITWNLGAQRIKGYSAEEIIGKHFSIFYPIEDIQNGKPAMELEVAARVGRYQEEGWRLHKNGSRFWANVLITALFDQSGKLRGFGKVTRDITERKHTEEALRHSEERFRILVEGVHDYAIFLLDPQGYISTWNTGAQLIKGYSANEVIGEHVSIFYPPEDVLSGKANEELRIAAAQGRYEEQEGLRVRKDGSRFWANIVISALYDADGELRGFSKVTRDITDRKQAEVARQQLLERERQLERERESRVQMEELLRIRDEFLTVTAHELRTPVTSLMGYAQLLQRRLERGDVSPERMHRAVRTVIHQARRLNQLTTMLLDLTRLEHGKLSLDRAAIDLRGSVERVLDEIQLLTDQHTLEIKLPPFPIVIEGDELRLEQVFYNLLQNAIKYSPLGGAITVNVCNSGSQAVVTIADRGLGIPAADLPHVFDRFYRAANVATEHISGMGIGLYIVKELVTLHGGTIDVSSVPGEGSIFRVIFPLIAVTRL